PGSTNTVPLIRGSRLVGSRNPVWVWNSVSKCSNKSPYPKSPHSNPSLIHHFAPVMLAMAGARACSRLVVFADYHGNYNVFTFWRESRRDGCKNTTECWRERTVS